MSLESQTPNTKPSLKEAMKDHWENRSFTISPEKANVAGVSLFLYSVLFFPIINIFWLLPSLYYDWHSYGWRCLFSLFLMIEAFINWRGCMKNHDDIVLCPYCKAQGATVEKQKILAAREDGKDYCDRWKFCLFCQVDAPPRSHHCKVCQVCVLKRDHHCFFTFRCIGHHTQRRFFVLCFYITAASSWFGFCCASYLNAILPARIGWVLLDYFLPLTFFKFVFSGIQFKFLFIMFHLYLSLALCGLAAVYFFWEILLILDEKTSFEAMKVIGRYRRDLGSNIRSVFGNYFPIHFLWPFETPLPGDGYNWPLNKSVKGH